MTRSAQSIAIIGAGPAGSTLAALLARDGARVTLFEDGKRPDLIVGESLIPAVMATLQELGLEEEIAAIGLRKPGVSFQFSRGESIDFNFAAVDRCALPTYAFNVPRPAFDQVLERCAERAGAVRVRAQARVERDGDRLRLTAESLATAPHLAGRQPDLLVDATGRRRMFAKLLGIGAQAGGRRDVAHFAHYENWAQEGPRGQVITQILEAGWSWRIPLQDRVSVGIVIDKAAMQALGATAEERMDAAIARDPALRAAAANARRITGVATYTNYQQLTDRGHGANWVMAGDAFGFVDPMLSPGLFLAMHSAKTLARELRGGSLARYDAEMRRWIAAWMELIAYYYDGRMFAMYHTGIGLERKYPGAFSRFMHGYIERQIACMASGATTASAWSRGVIRFLARYSIFGANPSELAVR